MNPVLIVLGTWFWMNGVAIYILALRGSRRTRAAVALGALTWPVSAPAELAYRGARRYLDKVLP